MERFKRIKKELRAHGATPAQAKGYVSLVKKFERQSAGVGEVHHILPKAEWKRFRRCRWNLVRVHWGLHVALHGYLVSMFPGDDKLLAGLRASTMRRRTDSQKKRRFKDRIVKWYQAHRSAEWISERAGVSPGIVWAWLRSWGVKTRSLSEAFTLPQKEKFKAQIIRWRIAGKTSDWIAKKIKVSQTTIWRWLHEWGVPTRSRLASQILKAA